MLRTLIAGALAILLALPVSSLTAQSSLQPAPALGKAFGAWDLPGAKDAGRARGVLVDASGRRFALEAKLVPVPVRGDQQAGRILGVLLPLDREGIAGRPFAELQGGYLAGPDGLGSFDGLITPLDPLVQFNGRIAGRFADPAVRGRDPVGRFAGRWAVR